MSHAIQTALQHDYRAAALVLSAFLAHLSTAKSVGEVNAAAARATRELEALGREVETLERANCGGRPREA